MRFGQDLEELFADVYRTRAAGLGRRGRFVFWLRVSADTVRHGLSERLPQHRRLPLGAHHSKESVMAYLLEDLRHASRALHHQRGLSLVVMLTLALAIGANSAIFTIVNAVLLRPLPYADPDRLVMIYMVAPNGRDTFLSLPDFEDFRANLKSIKGLSLMGTQTANLTGVAEPDRLRAGFVTADFFGTFGVQPIIGRAFREGEDARGAQKTAVLEYDIWQARSEVTPRSSVDR
jgi:hypothetical protein